MKKIIVLAVIACFAAMNVNAQTAETESKEEKMLRLTKAADENPTDWKAQMEAGDFLLDKENGMYNPSQAEKYYERLFQLATDYNKEIPGSVIGKTGFALAMLAMAPEKNDPDLALSYIDAMRQANTAGMAAVLHDGASREADQGQEAGNRVHGRYDGYAVRGGDVEIQEDVQR